MEKLKILIASETYPPNINGAAKFSGQLVKALSNNGHRVVVIAPSISTKNGIENSGELKIFRMASVKVKTIHPYFRAVVPININKKVEKIIKDFKYHISNLWEPPSRIDRIIELLSSKEKHSVNDFMQYQMDIVSPYAREIIPYLINAFRNKIGRAHV